MSKYKNPFKVKLYEQYKNEVIKQKLDFEQIWNNSMRMAVGFIGGRRNRFGQKYSEVASYLAREKILEQKYGQKSFYSRFEEASGTFKTKFYEASLSEYKERTESFRKIYGKEEIEYYGEIHSLDTWFEFYEDNKISRDDLNDIISELKKNNEKYLKADYNATAQNNDIANNLDDFFD